ncbi:hypothetical protein MRX96_017810 [Rhipicephalus microplus]|uniref:Uncharacterized protein n=1 Tax=Rhipicephalus microplus TaxID=6941 RepID=A0A9J6EI90_RHIMP|nr:uncharacterized protein LOC119162310 [Rhipicephalus microplus]KAH8033861.1 hypothetical protein HPB51_016633 [Rhipicephalus microplus]
MSNVLEELLAYLKRVPTHELHCLDDENVDWLPRLRRVCPGITVQEIRQALEATPDVIECLLRVAKLYCWLISRYHLCPWLLIRFEANMLLFDLHQLIRDLAAALQSIPRRHTTIRVRHECGAYYACLINNYANPDHREGGVMFLVLWRGHQFAATYAKTNEELQALTTALQVVLHGERVELLLRPHADLDAAYFAGRQSIGGPRLLTTR